MTDIVSDVLIALFAVVMAILMLAFVSVMILGILNIIGDIVDWFVQRFGR